jgi:hypothetical protein
MKLFFLLLWQLYWFKFTPVLWNYTCIYLIWNKASFRYFKIFNISPSEIGNMALRKKINLMAIKKSDVACVHWRNISQYMTQVRDVAPGPLVYTMCALLHWNFGFISLEYRSSSKMHGCYQPSLGIYSFADYSSQCVQLLHWKLSHGILII